MEATGFEDFLERLTSRGIEIDTGTSKKYGTVTKYKFPEEKNFHRGYSLGTFYSDMNIKKRIDRHIMYLADQENRKSARKEAAKKNHESMPLSEIIIKQIHT